MRPPGKSYKSEAHRRGARVYYDRHAEKLREKSRRFYWNNRERCLANNRRWRINNPDKLAARRLKEKEERTQLKCHLRKTYGITIEERDALFAKNGGMCWICSKSVSECVDHDHDSGKIRGALCRTCNAGLGLFKDNADIVLSAALYLKSERTFQ